MGFGVVSSQASHKTNGTPIKITASPNKALYLFFTLKILNQ